MQNKSITIGLDVGNYDTKTSSSTIPSCFIKTTTIPFGTKDYLQYNGSYYIPETNSRFPYERDKTKNENCFILSLMGIASELKVCAERKFNSEDLKVELKADLERPKSIKLGVGLPPTHCSTLGKKTEQYYLDMFKNGRTFNYSGYNFSLSLEDCKVFPQNFAAIVTQRPKNENSILKKYKSYFGVDIGGWTVDIIAIMNNELNFKMCDSKPLGVLKMIDEIIKQIEEKYGDRLTSGTISDVLQGEPTLLAEPVINQILLLAEGWFDQILDELVQFGVEFNVYPILFLGGGSLLFKSFIRKSKRIVKYELISNPRANAEGYRRLMNLG